MYKNIRFRWITIPALTENGTAQQQNCTAPGVEKVLLNINRYIDRQSALYSETYIRLDKVY